MYLTTFQRINIKAAVLAVVATACTMIMGKPEITPLPSIPAWDLILDSQPFPESWIVDPCGPPQRACERQYRATESSRTFGRVGIAGHVIQEVSRVPSVSAAKAKFNTSRGVDFNALVPPPEIPYRSPIADEYYLGCGKDRGVVPICRAIFRYGNYFVYFFIHIDGGNGEGLKIQQVEPILRAMDEKASSALGIPLPKTP